MLQSTSRRHENTGKMWSHIKKRTDSKINLFSFAIMLVLLRSLFPSHDLLKLSSTQYSVRVPCLFSWQELSSSGKVVQLVSSPPRRQLATRHSFFFCKSQKKQAWRRRRRSTKNGQIVVQWSISWKWFCAQYLNYINKVRMKLDSALNLEDKRVSNNFEIFWWVSFLDA